MPLPRASLSTFLTSAKTLLSNAITSPSQQSSHLTFVIGNESADLDSLCSAVLLAYLRTYFPAHAPSSNPTSNSKPTFYIPLSNLSRADLSLRPELHPVLSRANLNTGDLLTLCDLPKSLAAKRTRWVLVDHNAMAGELGEKYGARVVGVVDHHADEGKELLEEDGEDNEGKVIQTVGSCASLVVEEWRSRRRSALEENPVWDSQLAGIGLGPIVVDTANLTSKEKTTKTDVEAVKFLDGLLAQGSEVGKAFDRKSYYEEVTKAKQDIGSLSLYDILRKDYKQWGEASGSINMGVSSIVKDISFLISKAGGEKKFCLELERFAQERGLSIMAVMTTSHQGEDFKRELLVWGLDEKGMQAAAKFEDDNKAKLGLVRPLETRVG
ncbi:uncharacterized protein BP5553_09342 [Venustampulla echinocandica]|uniref:DHHA2 domain-containing protein n=1 Tax=Venustampulla echinocandica TaxID=2656787 RepID=A0A370TCF6_9HELO|nr:uncharacterized protein BP5553_09342 [Venustampulla echinocandica]RDL31940.1 hypothetical protein BP5553_09342 [Venustampulla echinocandica]